MKLSVSFFGLIVFLTLSAPAVAQEDGNKGKDKTTPTKMNGREANGQYGIGSDFPDFEYLDLKKQKHQSDEILGKDQTFLVIFNPTCTHCIASAKLFQDNLAAFDHVQIFYLAGEGMLPYLEEFYEETGLQKEGPVKVGVDNSRITYKLFLYQNLPQINVYDKGGKLVDQMTGEAALEEVLRYKNN